MKKEEGAQGLESLCENGQNKPYRQEKTVQSSLRDLEINPAGLRTVAAPRLTRKIEEPGLSWLQGLKPKKFLWHARFARPAMRGLCSPD